MYYFYTMNYLTLYTIKLTDADLNLLIFVYRSEIAKTIEVARLRSYKVRPSCGSAYSFCTVRMVTVIHKPGGLIIGAKF